MQFSARDRLAVQSLIDRYQLHRPPLVPVPIRSVAESEGWDVALNYQMRSLWGLAVAHGGIRLMWVNGRLAPSWQRMVIAHELGHWLMGDFESGLTFEASIGQSDHPGIGWMSRRIERRAYVVASWLLIPSWVMAEYDERPDVIAAVCDVPEWLVTLRWEVGETR